MTQQTESIEGTTLKDGYVDLDDIRLHVVEAGPEDGQRIVMLHGFPEFWYSWRKQIPALAAAGFRVIVPDMRGYNLSDKPHGRKHYAMTKLTADVAHLIEATGKGRAHVIAHDWGVGVAWGFAMTYGKDLLNRYVAMNGPHPASFAKKLMSPSQLLKSWYMFFFQLPYFPERALAANNFAKLVAPFKDDPLDKGTFTEDDIQKYREAFARPYAITGPLNYYRAMFSLSNLKAFQVVDAPTLVIWGERDKYLGKDLASPMPRWVPNARVEYVPDACHWIHHEKPALVNKLIIDFLRTN